MKSLKVPYIYFGGKSRVAHVVWEGLGKIEQYVEPCLGSGAVLLARPLHFKCREVANDIDLLLTNFWRSLSLKPDQVIRHAQSPCNEIDLIARNNWLVNTQNDWRQKFVDDPEYCEPKHAGWWVWGASIWLGQGWCKRLVGKALPRLSGQGGIHRFSVDSIEDYLMGLSRRMFRVQIACGDWNRVVTPGATTVSNNGVVGVFLDPPYDDPGRSAGLYRHDNQIVSKRMRCWAVNNGDDPKFRIVFAGYFDQHDDKFPENWRRYQYTGPSSYQTTASAAQGNGNNLNRKKECLWFSPHCVQPKRGLFTHGR